MKTLSQRISNMAESQTLAMASLARELTNQGHDVIALSIGEPDFNTPEFIKEAAKRAIDENYSHYPPVPGYPEVREAICNKFKRDNNLEYSPEQIVISTGAKQSIANICFALLNPGDEVLLPVPYWVTYSAIIELVGAVPVEIPSSIDNDFKVSPEQLQEAITPKTKMLMFSSPCNPSGSVYARHELEAFAQLIAKHENIFVVSDEIYEHIIFEGEHVSIATFPEISERTITVNGVSKAWAMTGWRLGYIGAPKWIAQACNKVQGQFTSGSNTIAQMAAKAAVEANPEYTHDMRSAFLKRRNLVIEKLKEIPGLITNVPEGAFYVFFDVSHYFGKSSENKRITNATDLSMYLLEEAHVAVVTGEAFGDPNCMRISYATNEENIVEALKRMKISLQKLT